jgi:regulatory NSL complex subunit 3
LLIADNMAKLATEKLENEAIQKKIHVEGSAKKLRIILSSVSWDVKITQWLHLTLIEHLNRDYLLCYINMLQVLQSRVPTLVDRILNTPLTNSKLLTLNNQILNFVVGKPWEPALKPSVPPVTKVQPVTPFIIMVPSGTNNYNSLSR